MAFNLAQKFAALGTPGPLAKELAAQIESNTFNWKRLVELSMIPRQAKYLETSILAGDFSATKAMELGLSEATASLVKSSYGVLNAFSPAKEKLATGSGDVNGVVVGDSTSATSVRFVYLFFAWLATQYPAVSFVYYPPDGTGGYAAPVAISTGTGPRTFRLYNNSISGEQPWYFMGALFNGAFITPGRDWDFFLWNHGKNMTSLALQPLVQGEFLGAIAQTQLSFPSANHIMVDQFPNQDQGNLVSHNSIIDVVQSAPKISRINMWDKTYEAADYADNVHLTDAANITKLLPTMQGYWNTTKAGQWTPETPWLSVTATNLMDGPAAERFADFSLDGNGTVAGAANVIPAGWVQTGTATYSKETTTTYGGAVRAQRMVATGAAASRMTRTPPAAARAIVLGKNVMLTVIQYIDNGAAASVGRVSLVSNGTGGTTLNSKSDTDSRGAYRVQCIGPYFVPADATTLQANLIADSSSTPAGTHGVITQWATLVEGKLPRSA